MEKTAASEKTRRALVAVVALKKDVGLKQFQIAENLGISESMLCLWLKGRRPIPAYYFNLLLSELGVKKSKRIRKSS